MSRIAHVVVAIPARNEEATLGPCLRRLGAARRALARHRPEITVDVLVALDCCTDESAAVVARCGALGVPTQCGCVGGARDTAIVVGLRRARVHSPRMVWIANTDADTLVPPDWLTTQVELAESGVDLIVGTVEPAPDLDPIRLARWQERHELVEGHRHVHGANLGLRADAWLAVGGFGPLPSHEDVGLVSRLRAAGTPAIATDLTRVRTSARLVGRAEAGFAGYLAGLAPVGE